MRDNQRLLELVQEKEEARNRVTEAKIKLRRLQDELQDD
jgi:hypothetical protein